MTKPTLVFFGHDAVPRPTAKIFLRTLLYSTSARGKMIEAMYAKVRRGGSEQTFSFWGYGEYEKLTPGSGLFVGQTGAAFNHHFVLSAHQPVYEFAAGEYAIEVFVRLAGRSVATRLSEIKLTLDQQQAAVLANSEGGILFELQPDSQTYVGHADPRRRVRHPS